MEISFFFTLMQTFVTIREGGRNHLNILNKDTVEASLSRPPLGGTVGRSWAAHKEELHHIEAERCGGREQRRRVPTLICSQSTSASAEKPPIESWGDLQSFPLLPVYGTKGQRVPPKTARTSNGEVLASDVCCW